MEERRNDEIEEIAKRKAKRSAVILFIGLIVALVIIYFLYNGLMIRTILLVLLIIFATCIAGFYVLKKMYFDEEIEKIEENNT